MDILRVEFRIRSRLRHDPEEVETVMRDTGRAVAEVLGARIDQGGLLSERLAAASRLLNDELGAVTWKRTAKAPQSTGASCPFIGTDR